MTTIRFRRPQRWFGALALALTLSLAASGPGLTADPSPAPSGDLTQIDLPINPTAFVQIEVQGITREGDPYTETGFGLIVDPTGLILAPANLVAPDAPGVAIRYGDWNIAATIDSITVHASPTIGAPASATYTGQRPRRRRLSRRRGRRPRGAGRDVRRGAGVHRHAQRRREGRRHRRRARSSSAAASRRPPTRARSPSRATYSRDPGRSGLARDGRPGLRPPGRRRDRHRRVGPRPRPPDARTRRTRRRPTSGAGCRR